MRGARVWLLLYALAVLAAPVVHDHEAANSNVDAHDARCDDGRLHVSGHAAGGSTFDSHDCPSCHFRFHHSTPAESRPFDEPALNGDSALALREPTRPNSRWSCLASRAPPAFAIDGGFHV